MIPLPATGAELPAREAEARGTTPEIIKRDEIGDRIPSITERDIDLSPIVGRAPVACTLPASAHLDSRIPCKARLEIQQGCRPPD